jgi:predicted metal-dependent phosphoesterase TrpH
MAAPLGRAGLHVHTDRSDGRQGPEAVVRAASGRLDVLAITDHDTIAGALAARRYALRTPRSASTSSSARKSARSTDT